MEEIQTNAAHELFQRIPAEKRERILASAIAEFARHGFADANVNRVAAAAGVSVGALYKYFATKDDLYLHIVNAAQERVRQHVEEILAADIRFFSKVEKLLRLAQSFSRDEPELIKLYNVFVSENDPARATQLASAIEGVTAGAYRQMVAAAQADGEIPSTVDAGVLAFMLDNQLMLTQFSFACEYYKKRFSLYVGAQDAADDEYVIRALMQALRAMFGVGC